MFSLTIHFKDEDELRKTRSALVAGECALRNVRSMSDSYDKDADLLDALGDQLYAEPVTSPGHL